MKENKALASTHVNKKKYWLGNVIRSWIPHRKNKRLWIFSSNFGHYRDNAKYLFEYVSHTQEDISAVYFCATDEERDAVRSKGFSAVTIGSKEANKTAKRAGVTFYTHGIDDFGYKLHNYRSYVVSLWHGVWFKQIYYASPLYQDSLIKKIYRGLFSYVKRDLTISTSPYIRDLMMRTFKLKKDADIAIVGQPRNDLFFDAPRENDDKLRILYAPTYRQYDDYRAVNELMEFFYSEEGQKFLEERNAILYMKPHPLMREFVTRSSERIIDAMNLDTQELLLQADILITDYSSIVSDFALTKRKVVLYAPDYDEYSKYEPLDAKSDELYASAAVSKTVEDVISSLDEKDVLCDIINEVFNSDTDGSYCRKVTQAVRERIGI